MLPRLRLVRPGEAPDSPAEPVPADSPRTLPPLDPPAAPVPPDSPRARPPQDEPTAEPVPTDSPRARPPQDPPTAEPVPADSPRPLPPLHAPTDEPVPTDSPRPRPPQDPADSPPLRLTLAPPPIARVVAPAAALAELDELLARDLDDPACARLAALAEQVPGRLRAITSALARVPSSAAILALRSLPPAAPGQLDALIRCFSHGVPRVAPVLADTSPVPADSLLLALEFRSSRARGFPDLVARAQALAARGPAAEFAALDVDTRRHYRLSYHAGRCPPAALEAQLRAAHLDLAWLHARLLRLRGSRLWLGGWRFDVDDPLGPAAQGHLLQAWLRWAERGPAA